jgi:hypothetical protein
LARVLARVPHPAVEVEIAFQTVEQPLAKRAGLLRRPRLRVPAALVFGLFDERDLRVRLDHFDAAGGDLAIFRAATGRGKLPKRRQRVTIEPRRLRRTRGHLAGQDDLERPRGGRNAGVDVIGIETDDQVFIDETVKPIALPVEVFLNEPHLGPKPFRLASSKSRRWSCLGDRGGLSLRRSKHAFAINGRGKCLGQCDRRAA